MDSSSQTKNTTNSTKKVIIIAAVVIALLLIAVVVLLTRPPQNVEDGNVPKIGYAADAKVMLDQDSLQAAFDEANKNAEDGYVGLKYKNNAYSTNGTDFQCYIVNSESNKYDMFLAIYTDAGLSDQIFLSGLIPPGSGFEEVSLDHALESGDHTVYVVVTQVDTDEETGEQVIKNQVTHTMDFHVTK